jgi:hypothetical protein
MKIFSVIQSVLAAFCGIQSDKKFNEDDDFVDKNGVKYFLIIGFIFAFILGILLFTIVSLIIN